MEALRYQRSVIQTNLIEGRAEGRVEGKAEGIKENALSVARKALQKGMSIPDIMELTDLKEADIKEIICTLK